MCSKSKSSRIQNDRLLDFLASYCSEKIAERRSAIDSLGKVESYLQSYSYGYDKGSLSELEFVLSMIKTYYRFED